MWLREYDVMVMGEVERGFVSVLEESGEREVDKVGLLLQVRGIECLLRSLFLSFFLLFSYPDYTVSAHWSSLHSIDFGFSGKLVFLACLLYHNMSFLLPLLIIFTALPFAFINGTPLVIPCNKTHIYDPGSPWPAITDQVSITSNDASTQPLSTVDLHPGRI